LLPQELLQEMLPQELLQKMPQILRSLRLGPGNKLVHSFWLHSVQRRRHRQPVVVKRLLFQS
jgi:hypothetical protein